MSHTHREVHKSKSEAEQVSLKIVKKIVRGLKEESSEGFQQD